MLQQDSTKKKNKDIPSDTHADIQMPVQKLILSYTDGYVLFHDEKSNLHSYQFQNADDCPVVNIPSLVASCFQNTYEDIFTCRCGEAECLSFTGTSCEICGNDIYMDICVADYGHNRFHFNKEQYTDSVLNILYILKEKAEHDSERQVSYLTNTYLSLEEIEKFIGYYKK